MDGWMDNMTHLTSKKTPLLMEFSMEVDGGSHRFGFSLFENDINSREIPVGFLEIILGFSFVWGWFLVFLKDDAFEFRTISGNMWQETSWLLPSTPLKHDGILAPFSHKSILWNTCLSLLGTQYPYIYIYIQYVIELQIETEEVNVFPISR